MEKEVAAEKQKGTAAFTKGDWSTALQVPPHPTISIHSDTSYEN